MEKASCHIAVRSASWCGSLLAYADCLSNGKFRKLILKSTGALHSRVHWLLTYPANKEYLRPQILEAYAWFIRRGKTPALISLEPLLRWEASNHINKELKHPPAYVPLSACVHLIPPREIGATIIFQVEDYQRWERVLWIWSRYKTNDYKYKYHKTCLHFPSNSSPLPIYY